MIRFRFERTVVRPQVYAVRDARDSSFVDLPVLANVFSYIAGEWIPFQQLRFPQLKIRGQHTFSSTRRTTGI